MQWDSIFYLLMPWDYLLLALGGYGGSYARFEDDCLSESLRLSLDGDSWSDDDCASSPASGSIGLVRRFGKRTGKPERGDAMAIHADGSVSSHILGATTYPSKNGT